MDISVQVCNAIYLTVPVTVTEISLSRGCRQVTNLKKAKMSVVVKRDQISRRIKVRSLHTHKHMSVTVLLVYRSHY